MGFRRSVHASAASAHIACGDGPLSPADAQQPDLPGTSASPAGQMAIAIENGRITASVRNRPLGRYWRNSARGTGVALIPAADMDIEALRVSAELAGVPMDEGLRRLLENYDAFSYYGVGGNRSSSLRAVWIYHRGWGRTLRPVPPELWAGTKELQSSLADTDPEVRARGYEALMSRPDRESRELVIQGSSRSERAGRCGARTHSLHRLQHRHVVATRPADVSGALGCCRGSPPDRIECADIRANVEGGCAGSPDRFEPSRSGTREGDFGRA